MRGRDLKRFIEDKAGLWLDYGTMFGPDGDGFIRINLATQKSYLERALVQLTDAVGGPCTISRLPRRKPFESAHAKRPFP